MPRVTSGTEKEIRPFYILNRLAIGSVCSPPAEAFQVPRMRGGLHVVTAGFVRGAHRRNVAVRLDGGRRIWNACSPWA